MAIKEKKQRYFEYFTYLKTSINLAYRPSKLLDYSLKHSFTTLLFNSITLISIFSLTIVIVLALFNSEYSIENQIKISFAMFLISLLYLPGVLTSILFKNKILKTALKASFFICINIIVFYLSIPIFSLIIFFKSEIYFFYYAYLFLCIIIFFIYIIILPILYSKGNNHRIINILLSIVIALSFNISVSFIIKNQNNNIAESIDPIFYELRSNNLLERSRYDYLQDTGNIIINSVNKYLKNDNIKYLEELGLEEKPLLLLKESLLELEKKIHFRTNKQLITTSIEAADILRNIISQTSRITELSDELPQSIQKGIAYINDGKELIEKNQKIVNEDMTKINTILDKINNHLKDITTTEYNQMLKESTKLNNDIININLDIKKIDALLKNADAELETTDQYIEYLNKKNSVIKEITILIEEYEKNINDRIKAVKKIEQIYKLKNVFYFFP
ncbi:membrane hypothetical protein [uncultured spirochete]|jgi:hypothetical protein|uniref:Uncharacterized protein n=1 Tax=uncultured spirochete TaxID=156406 RepID=A0A3P3XG01_9SPIR|nr:hypothetical protein [Rectinema subterraneum]SLM09723.1 membrane hypothetical protein [uncultured spirochete]